MLSPFKDHATGCYYKGFRMLTLGWSDGHKFIPVDFSLLASLKSQINGMMEGIDKRTSDYKRRLEALLPAPEVNPAMVDRAIQSGMNVSYVLMDSWFMHAPLIQSIRARGLDVIGMVKKQTTNATLLVNIACCYRNFISRKHLYKEKRKAFFVSFTQNCLRAFLSSWC